MAPAAVGSVLGSVEAMACRATVHGTGAGDETARRDAGEALRIFGEVERACTRFDLDSPLMRANRRPDAWHDVPQLLFDAVREAHRAYQGTRGLFDPRVFRSLTALGYDRSLGFREGPVATVGSNDVFAAVEPWKPRFRGGERTSLRLGRAPIDLGGIGKGLAIRWASEALARRHDDFLVEAGGDCHAAGRGPDSAGWRVGVEDPRGDAEPLVVVELKDTACATSSVRLRRWRCDGRTVHHLIDPRTGRPGGSGLAAVTVIAPDPADAEVLSKTLFLRGAHGVARAASKSGCAAFWVRSDGSTGESDTFGRHVVWRRQ